MSAEQAPGLRFEIGHVWFIDIIVYSKKLIIEQSELLRHLTEAVAHAGSTSTVRMSGDSV